MFFTLFCIMARQIIVKFAPLFSLSRISLEWPVTVETARTIQLKFEEVSLQGQQPQPLPVPTSVEPGTFWGSASST